MLKLSIIIINYNTLKLTTACIKSIVNNYKKELESGLIEIIIVDNASKDGYAKELSKLKYLLPNLTLVESKQNLGFGKGNNLGAQKAKGKYLLFLNSDTVIEDSGLIKMVNYMEEYPEVSILGGKLKNLDKTQQRSTGSDFNLFNVVFLLLGFERFGFLRKGPKKIEKVAWVSGACLMIRKDVFNKIGGFEKELFMYMEDVDLCFRAKQQGFNTFFYPAINLIHQERGSSNRTFAILNIYKGLLFFFKKHKPYWQFVFVKTLLKIKAYTFSVIGRLTGNDYLYKTYNEAKTVC